mmetsp:Transcript_6840/g.14073  ORF Transcript_6840/g.14073 Transcript_6840/m.14073 type:complete len:112 (+) Transcript_6840:675-1010(+)
MSKSRRTRIILTSQRMIWNLPRFGKPPSIQSQAGPTIIIQRQERRLGTNHLLADYTKPNTRSGSKADQSDFTEGNKIIKCLESRCHSCNTVVSPSENKLLRDIGYHRSYRD